MTYKGFIAGIVTTATVLGAGMAVAQSPERGPGKGPGCGGPRHERPTFQQLDTDGNGEITKEEMQARMAARFAEADTDGDGKLSLDEMQAKARQRADDRAKWMLEKFDADGDGFLSAEEMPKPKREGGMDKMFERADTDKSGGISEEEFKAMGDHKRGHDGKFGGKHGGKMDHGMKRHGDCGPDKG